MCKGDRGQIKGFVEFARGSRSVVGSPVALANVAKLLAQVAMEQAMDEISEYLDAIDAKVDDVLRAQKDGVLSRMIGRGLVIEEAMTVRLQRGGVDEVTWSKVQGGPADDRGDPGVRLAAAGRARGEDGAAGQDRGTRGDGA